MNRRTWNRLVARAVAGGLAGFLPAARTSEADEPAASSRDVQVSDHGTPTLGGMQFWADRHWLQGWKIQQHIYTHHCRLLDPRNGRRFSGSLDDCRIALRQVRQQHGLKSDTGRAVVLIHGIIRSSKSFRRMAAALQSTHETVIGFEYPSTRVPMNVSAEYLHRVLQSLSEIDTIDLVGHSMGGLIVRSYLEQHRDPRLGRLVMLGTPNRGAELAALFRSHLLYRWVLGPAGQELTSDADGIIGSLPIPDLPFGIVAGGNGCDGYNPLLPGDDDGTVTVHSARLAGAADFLRVPRLHSFLMRDERVIRATAHFLRHGQFEPDRKPAPIPGVASEADRNAGGGRPIGPAAPPKPPAGHPQSSRLTG